MQNMDRQMVGSDCSLTEALYQNFTGGTEENHERLEDSR
jgi:hypothetical protein